MSSNAVRYEEGYFLKAVFIVKTDFSFQCCIGPLSLQKLPSRQQQHSFESDFPQWFCWASFSESCGNEHKNYNALFRILDRSSYKALYEKNPKFRSTHKMQTKLFDAWGEELRNQSLILKNERTNIVCSVLIYCTT